MPIFIACSPSTGSSLLRRILNRHSQVFCGPETSLFAKKEFYTNWNSYKDNFISRQSDQLLNVGWHHMKGLNLQDENEISNSLINKMASDSSDFVSFVNAYFDVLLHDNNKRIWAEKTPSNAFAIDDFKNLFPDSKLVHVVRDPYDTVASLINRGMSVYNALTVYLLNVCQCLEHKGEAYYQEVCYEELVVDPKTAVGDLCEFLGINFEADMIESSAQEKGVDHMVGWNYKETSQIGKKSVGRFDKLPEQTKALIHIGMQQLQSVIGTSNKSYDDIFDSLKYIEKEVPVSNHNFYFQKEMFKDKFKRLMQKSYFRANNYPVTWIK